jgi:hypothetical protein
VWLAGSVTGVVWTGTEAATVCVTCLVRVGKARAVADETLAKHRGPEPRTEPEMAGSWIRVAAMVMLAASARATGYLAKQ